MKLEEAKKKWCPFAFVLDGNVAAMAGVNRPSPKTIPKCLVEKCMMWTGKDCGLKNV